MKSTVTNLKSGIVVYLVALPLCLGIALACNVPLFSGIIAGIVGGLVVTFASGSKLSVSGPAAGLTAIVLSSVAALGTFELFIAAVFFAGAIQILLGIVKAGTIGHFIPVAVIKGMLAGIGIILIMKQIPHLVGYDRDPDGDFDFMQNDGHNTISDLYYMFRYITPGAVIIGAVSLLLIVLGQKSFYRNNRFFSFIPTALLAVIVGALLNYVFRNSEFLALQPDHLVALPLIKNIEDLKQNIIQPDFSGLANIKFWTISLTIALVASIESLLSIEATDKIDPHKQVTDPSRELIAQGLGNMASGLLGGLPVTAVIVRSSANIDAGATGKLSAGFHAILLLLSVLFIPHFLMLIPSSALAAILIIVGYKLTQVSVFKELYLKGMDQFLPFIATISVMLLTDLLKGVGAGVVVAVIFIIRNSMRSSFDVVEDIIGGKRNYMMKLPQHITFFNKGFVISYLSKVKDNSHMIIDGSINKSTDKDVQEVLRDFVEISAERNIEIQFVKYNL
ncbi:MAG: SulP family inorganic anion transporter [bacterium]|nr:SulP family inorganic anion transporter [bacterium]